jgi:predicted RNA binding protein YcfA (HicA-like mRNA interferase family)
MPSVETNTRKIISRLEREGWVNVGGGSHDRFVNEERPEMMIPVPRHRELTPGTARSIAKAAGWN